MKASSHHPIPPDPDIVQAPKKPFSIEPTVQTLPEDITLFLRAKIPRPIMKRIPMWFSFALTEAMSKAADEIERLRLSLAIHQNESFINGERRLAVLILREQYNNLLALLERERSLPEEQHTVSADLALAFEKVRKHLANSVK